MRKISAVLLTKNEEKRIERCLRSISWVDEIVVVDTGSTDRTVPLVRTFTDRISRGDIAQGFAHNRNLGNQRASHDWVLKIDPDEVVSDALREEILRVMGEDAGVDGYLAATRAYFGDRWIRGCGWYPMTQVRLFDKREAFWEGLVHERLVLRGKTGRLENDILHYSYDDLQHYFQKFNLYTSFEARALMEAGRRISPWNMPGAFLLRPLGLFLRSYLLQKGWRDGFHGFLVSACSSFYVLVKHMKLYEMQRNPSTNVPGNLLRDSRED